MKTILTDLGGVLLTNGWDTGCRKRAAAHFNLDPAELDERHRLIYDIFEVGHVTLHEYLKQVIFYTKRTFSEADFIAFMEEQSQPIDEMLQLFKELAATPGVRIGAISNESRELGAYRVRTFALDAFIDFFVISGCVGLRKPDPAFFQLALDIAQQDKKDVIYVDDRQLLVDVAAECGIPSFRHVDLTSTKEKLSAYLLQNSQEEATLV